MSLFRRSDTGEIRDISPEIVAALPEGKRALWEPYVPPELGPIVPLELPAWRVKVVAHLQGLAPAIDAALANLPEPQRTVATLAWSEGNVVRRDSPMVEQLAAGLGLTDQQIDQLFLAAEALEV